jgi:hypothetical protein
MAADKLNILGTEFEFLGDDKNRINLFEKNDKPELFTAMKSDENLADST